MNCSLSRWAQYTFDSDIDCNSLNIGWPCSCSCHNKRTGSTSNIQRTRSAASSSLSHEDCSIRQFAHKRRQVISGSISYFLLLPSMFFEKIVQLRDSLSSMNVLSVPPVEVSDNNSTLNEASYSFFAFAKLEYTKLLQLVGVTIPFQISISLDHVCWQPCSAFG